MQIQDVAAASPTANVTVSTTTETVAVSSGVAQSKRNSAIAIILAWYVMSSGVGTTSITPRIRRGTLITDPLVGEGNAVALAAAAGSNEQGFIIQVEQITSEGNQQYSLTVQQAAATGDGILAQSGIVVLLI